MSEPSPPTDEIENYVFIFKAERNPITAGESATFKDLDDGFVVYRGDPDVVVTDGETADGGSAGSGGTSDGGDAGSSAGDEMDGGRRVEYSFAVEDRIEVTEPLYGSDILELLNETGTEASTYSFLLQVPGSTAPTAFSLVACEIPKESDGNPDYETETTVISGARNTALFSISFEEAFYNKATDSWIGDRQYIAPIEVPLTFTYTGLEPADATDFSSDCLLYTSPSPRDRQKSRMPSSA